MTKREQSGAPPVSGGASAPRAQDPWRGLMVSASGVRGIVGESLTPDVILRFAGAHGSLLGPGPVVTGRDSRPSGAWVLRAAQAALLATGHDVVDVGIAPTPTILFSIRGHEAAGGLAVTASHNPAPWNALKLFGPGGTFLPPAQSEAVARRAREGTPEWVSHDRVGQARTDDAAIARHRAAILALPGIDADRIRARRFRAAVDATNGAGSIAAPELLRALGCEVEAIHCTPDGRFPRVPEPLPENLGDLGDLVRRTGAEVGFAYDPDADRLAIVDERGTPIGEERTLQIAVDWALARSPGLVVVNASTSMGVEAIARRYGAVVERTRVGEAHVAQTLLSRGGVIGGEGNGGVIYPALHATRDGLLAAGITLDWLARDKRSLSERVAELPPLFMIKRSLHLRLTDAEGTAASLRAAFPEAERNVLDGEKYVWEDAWVQVRASGTEPIVRIIAEAPSRDRAEGLVTRAAEAVERSQGSARPAPQGG